MLLLGKSLYQFILVIGSTPPQFLFRTLGLPLSYWTLRPQHDWIYFGSNKSKLTSRKMGKNTLILPKDSQLDKNSFRTPSEVFPKSKNINLFLIIKLDMFLLCFRIIIVLFRFTSWYFMSRLNLLILSHFTISKWIVQNFSHGRLVIIYFVLEINDDWKYIFYDK